MEEPVKCRICGCTQEKACPGGCAWEPGEGDLCTVCAGFIQELICYAIECNQVTAESLAQCLKEAVRMFKESSSPGLVMIP